MQYAHVKQNWMDYKNEGRCTWKHTCMKMFVFTGKPLSILYINQKLQTSLYPYIISFTVAYFTFVIPKFINLYM